MTTLSCGACGTWSDTVIPRHVPLFGLHLGRLVDAGQLGEPVHLDLLDVLVDQPHGLALGDDDALGVPGARDILQHWASLWSHGQPLKWSLGTSWVRPLLWT